MTRDSSPFKRDFHPVVLKQIVVDCDIPQGDLASLTGLARATINVAINRGWFPPTKPNFKVTIEQIIKENKRATQWLIERGLRIEDIWKPLGRDMRKANPVGLAGRSAATKKVKATTPGNPEAITINWEVEMITQEALRHFKLFRNPFIDDIQKDSDIYMSDEHRYIEAAMLDAAKHGGFLAVIGEVGSGKSVMRRKVVEQLRREEDVLVIYPQIVDKTRLTAASICDAIIMDISSEKPKIKLEQKTRQVQQLLLDRSKSGYRACLIIEEAHDLGVNTLKYLKRFYELEDGYKKLLGIILIGQTELKNMFNESMHVDMREVIRRCQVAEIRGLNGLLKEYLGVKLKRVSSSVDGIFSDGAIDALSKRLTSTDRQSRKVSHAYPLLVNNYAAKAMNAAFEMGEEKVTEGVVMGI